MTISNNGRLTAVLLSLSGSLPAFAGSASQSISDVLNLLLRAGENKIQEKLSFEDCAALQKIAAANQNELIRFLSVAKEILSQRCSSEKSSFVALENEPSGTVNLGKLPADEIWDGTAQCQAGNERILQCEHKGENGRGLLIYSGSESPENFPTLVCAQFEATFRSPFEREQSVDARCVVTEFDWRYESARSDALGVKNWLTQKVSHAPLQIPSTLKKQCEAVFPDAIYCTPTLIVFPANQESEVEICRLRTQDNVVSIGSLLRIGSWNSRWNCESKSTVMPDHDQRLSVEERSCVPDHLGQQKSPYCRFPYLPVARRPVRTYIE